MNDYLWTYTGEKTYPCNLCLKVFSQDGNLIKTCTGKTTFTCNQSLKYFSQYGNLNKHLKIFEGEKLAVW